METIVALSTPPGNSGVSVVRISGEKSKMVLQSIIHEKLEFVPRTMYLKKVYAKGATDKCLVVFFKAPFSFTGEDVVEIQSHGGYHLSQMIIEECLSLGCVMAGAGEFSKRAFLNGKLSLDQAEGIMDLINAENDMQVSAGSKLMGGKLFEIVTDLQNKLTDILAEIEAKLDYPEYEYTESETTNTKQKLINVIDELNKFVATGVEGQFIKNGVKVALVGSPNVGKSSLLNALTDSDKAIVTSVAGTTRDIVEAEYQYNGIIFRLFDTAGIHESDDIVENIGINKAKRMLEDADIVLKIYDTKEDKKDVLSTNKPYIVVLNKSDLIDSIKDEKCAKNSIYVSAKTGYNIDKLKKLIFDLTVKGKVDTNSFYLTNIRHIDCIKKAIEMLKEAHSIFENATMDVVSSTIKQAWFALGEITGTTSDEAIIDKIFSKFCLGK